MRWKFLVPHMGLVATVLDSAGPDKHSIKISETLFPRKFLGMNDKLLSITSIVWLY